MSEDGMITCFGGLDFDIDENGADLQACVRAGRLARYLGVSTYVLCYYIGAAFALRLEVMDVGEFDPASPIGPVLTAHLCYKFDKPVLLPKNRTWRKLRLAVFERDKHTCRYCGAQGVTLECDHVIPVTRGGSSQIENLAAACLPCNRSKGDLLVGEWEPKIRRQDPARAT